MRQMKPGSRRVALGACGLLVAISCSRNPFRDPSCKPTGDDPNPVSTEGNIALFTEEGTPIELPDAVVSCTQGAAEFARAQYRPEFGFGAILENGAVRVVRGDGTLFNYYTCGVSGVILRRCSTPLRVRVEAPGCEPYERSFTWDENFDLNGPNRTSFLVPVRLRCATDPAADPAMRDIPALNRDSGTQDRDAPNTRDSTPDTDTGS